MKIKLTLIITLLISSMAASAQKEFTLEDLNFGGKNARKFTPENKYLTWWGDEPVRLDMDYCYRIIKKDGKEETLVTLDEVKEACKSYEGAPSVRGLYWAEFPYADQPLVLLADNKAQMLYNFVEKEIVWCQNIQGADHMDWNPSSRAVAFVKDNQLYVTDAENNTQQLSKDGSREIVYGQSVHRDEFGIHKGTFWSPNGERLAFYRMDQSMVADYPQVDIFQRMATCEPDKYPMAGQTSHKVTVGVYDMKTRKTVYLNAGDPTDRYFTNIAWSPDAETIYIFELNRDQNDCRLVAYNAQTGEKIKELYKETDEKYVEPQNPIQFLPWDSEKFIMQSQKDGYNHLYLFSKDGQELQQLTKGEWVVMDVLGFDEKQKSIIIASNEASPLQRNTWSVSIKNGKRKLIGENSGWHNPTLSPSGQYIIDNYSAPAVPRKIDIVSTKAGKSLNLLTAKDPWEGYKQPIFENGKLTANDGKTDLYYRMVKPADFDPAKKYPTVIYVYGGPHAHNVQASWHWGSRSWETYMAQKGYILFILDNRGSENRGKEFEQATFRQLGQVEMQDQMTGVSYLKSLPYVDADKIGVHGWSFGGFMTISLMTNHPDVFKVGVAGGPVIDWQWYEVMYGERYMDTPKSNPKGYAKTSLMFKAKDLKGKLQIITGYNDPVVVPQHCLAFIAECIKQGTQPDFFVYPGEPHNMRGHQSVHLHERITQYFEDYLSPSPNPSPYGEGRR